MSCPNCLNLSQVRNYFVRSCKLACCDSMLEQLILIMVPYEYLFLPYLMVLSLDYKYEHFSILISNASDRNMGCYDKRVDHATYKFVQHLLATFSVNSQMKVVFDIIYNIITVL